MNREQILVSDNEVREFLEKYYSHTAVELAYLTGGKHSEAFSFLEEGVYYVIRFNENERGFLKDRYAYEILSNENLIIPKIYDIGKYKENVHYCISERLEGKIPKNDYKIGDFSSLPVQFETIEKIKNIPIPEEYIGYDEIEIGKVTRFSTLEEYLMNIYTSKELFDWEALKEISYFDQDFVDYLISRVTSLCKYSANVRELLHGDFGNENIFIKDGKVTGIIDWERLRIADHFLDVGRVVLFCPNREETVRAVLHFYKNKEYEYYKERIALGVYFAMIRNYGTAAKSGNETSCASSRDRIKEFEELMEKYS